MGEIDATHFSKNVVKERPYILPQRKRVRSNNGIKRKKIPKESNLEELEDLYETQLKEPGMIKPLLPIKTNKGIIARYLPQEDVNQDLADNSLMESSETESINDEYTLDSNDSFVPQSTADLLARYSESLRNKKVHIGYLCSSILENPEERISNFRILFKILEDATIDASLSIKKLAVVSMLEVFKDILPSYQIKHQDIKNVKLKKDTLKLQKYEEVLLQYYKKYLQMLEKFLKILIQKRGDTRKPLVEQVKLGEVALHSLCDLLVTHPYFNFSQNIAQVVIPFLNHKEADIRKIVTLACITIFKEDKKEEITLKILRILNHYLKKKAHVRSDILEVLLHLKLRDVNLDQEKENEIKQKKIMSHKQNILKLSKKERKRKKRLQELEKEMLETKAEESKYSKQKNVTEITKIIFGIYFRILKSSTNTQVVGICLKGLTKFSRFINLDYYVDLLNMLNELLSKEWLRYREQIQCVQTVFSILHEQGDAINLDPTRFYTCLYSNLLNTYPSKTYGNCNLILGTLSNVLIKRRKKITNKRTIGFVKRILTLCLQLLHNGSLGMLGLTKQCLILNKSVDILLDLDSSVGNGDYQPEVNDPEYCNASSTALYELTLLGKHYHPIVGKFARHIANGAPSTGEGSLPIQINKSSAEQLFTDFSMDEMVFNPPIQNPKKVQPKWRRKRTYFVDENFKEYCDLIVKRSKYSVFS